MDAAQVLGQESADERLPTHHLSFQLGQITLRTGITVLAMGLLSTWVSLHYGDGPRAIAALVLAAGLLTLSLIDLDHQLLPDMLVLPLLRLANSFELFTSLYNALWGAVAGYVVLWIIRGLSKLVTVVTAWVNAI